MIFDIAYAQFDIEYSESVFVSTMDIWDFVLLWISLVVLFSWIISMAYILWWGVLLILSWWKEDKIKPAINSIRYAVIWLILIVISIFAFPKLAALLWLNAEKYSSPDKIFDKIEELWTKILWGESSNDYGNYNWQDLDSLPDDFSEL